MRTRILSISLFVLVAGCVPGYSLVSPSTVEVSNGSVSVTTAIPWNKVPGRADGIKQSERWTLNGVVLDSVSFLGGVEDGGRIVRQKTKDERQVPTFSTAMTPPELVTMIESYYRIAVGAIDYQTTNVMPTEFLGAPGMQIDYGFTGVDDVKRRGRTVLAVVEDKLYSMSAIGADLHYFDTMLPEFESMVQSARLN